MGPPVTIAALQRRPKLLVVAFTASVLVAVAALHVADLWFGHQRTLKAAESRALNLAMVLSEYVHGSFALADTSLRQLAIHGRRVGGAAASAEAWDPILSAAKAALAGSGSITVTDAEGLIRHSTQRVIIGQSRREQYAFKQLSTIDRDELIVDRPFLTQVPPRRFLIPIGRRLVTESETFGGMVVATLGPEVYREFFRTVDAGRDGIIWVFHPDGVILFREPSTTNPIGEAATGNPVLQAALRAPGQGIVEGPLEAEGRRFVSAYQTMSAPPLIVGISLSRAEVLADWRAHVRTSAIAFGALTLTLAGIVLVLFRQMTARTNVERELSEVQRLEAIRLREANERLEAALEREQRARRETEAASYLKDQFLMTVSHELRTPLTAIYGWVRMLSSQSLPPGQWARALDAVERNARAQTRLIDDLLDVSRAISGKLRIEARSINVADVMHAAVETFKPALEAKGIRFESSLGADLGPVVADPDRLQQIVWNLLSNAIKFTPDGGTVRLRVARVESNIEIVVSDSGVGIAPEFLPYVFERFHQADAGTRRRYGGLGLGLAIVRHLVELHGGTVAAESAGVGKGATFRIVLPARAAPPDAQPAPFTAQILPWSAGASRLDGVRVLIVDDEPDSRELFASILQSAGASVLTASSAADALRLLADEGADALLSDIEMPGEDGYQLLQRARADPRIPRFIAVAVTAYARTVDRRRALEAGFEWHLSKPVEPVELVVVIASLVDARREQEPLSP